MYTRNYGDDFDPALYAAALDNFIVTGGEGYDPSYAAFILDREVRRGYEDGSDIEETAERIHGLGNPIQDAQTQPWPHILIYSPLSYFYSSGHLKKNLSCTIVFTPILYPLGMIGYAVFSLPMRIVVFACAFLGSVCCLLSIGREGYWEQLKLRLIFTAGALGELISGAIGCACPIVAYKLDEWIQSNEAIHREFAKRLLSFSVRDFQAFFENPDDYDPADHNFVMDAFGPLARAMAESAGNEARVERKNAEAEECKIYFQRAVERLLSVEALREGIDYQFDNDSPITFGLFLVAIDEMDEDENLFGKLIENIVDRRPRESRDADRRTLQGFYATFKEEYRSLREDNYDKEHIEQMMINALVAKAEDKSIPSESSAMYKALHNFQGWLATGDREMSNLLLRKAYEGRE